MYEEICDPSLQKASVSLYKTAKDNHFGGTEMVQRHKTFKKCVVLKNC